MCAKVKVTEYLVSEKTEIIANAQLIRKALCATETLETEKTKLETEMSALVEIKA